MEKKKEKKSFNKKKAALMAAAIIAAGGIGVGGAAAYFSATSATKDNQITLVAGSADDNKGLDGTGAGKIEEDDWDKTGKDAAAKGLQPNAVVAKDPKLKSNVAYPSYVLAKVTVPKVSATLNAGETLAPHEIVTLSNRADGSKGTVAAPDIASDWVLVDETNNDTAHTYYFAYTKELAPGAETSEIFQTIKVPNFRQVDLGKAAGGKSVDKKVFDVDVRAAMIQTEGYEKASDTNKDTYKNTTTYQTLRTAVDAAEKK